MTVETFFDKFELFVDAPNAVEKMRELILELAVHGNLLAQDDDDEPATKQLERIAAKKRDAGNTKRREKGLFDKGQHAVPLTLPEGWAQASLGELVRVLNGRAYAKPELLTAGTPVLRVGNLFTSNHWYYSDLRLEPDKYCDTGDLLFAWSASFGPFIWTGPRAIYHYHIWKLDLYSPADLDKRFLYWFLQNKTQEIKRAGHGVSMTHMTKERMERLPVGLPPLAEQKRITAKVDELMALCDRLQVQQAEREAKHGVLARAALGRFAEAPTPGSLGYLFNSSCPINPGDLRKSILTLAVRGKLVAQNPQDRPAADEIAATRKQMQVPARVWTEGDDASFDIPPGWCWASVDDVAESRLGKMLDAEKNRGEPHPYLRNTNVHWFRFELDNIKTMLLDPAEVDDFRLKRGDVMICEGGHGIARSAVWEEQLPGMTFQKALHRVRPLSCLNPFFFTFCLRVYEAEGVLQRYYTGAGIPHFTGRSLAKVVFPLPPVAEQRRIVAKVDQLMALVDRLDAQLAESRSSAERLMEAAVAELTQAAPAAELVEM